MYHDGADSWWWWWWCGLGWIQLYCAVCLWKLQNRTLELNIFFLQNIPSPTYYLDTYYEILRQGVKPDYIFISPQPMMIDMLRLGTEAVLTSVSSRTVGTGGSRFVHLGS